MRSESSSPLFYLKHLLLLIVMMYVISPWTFERSIYINEIIAFSGFVVLAFNVKKLKLGTGIIYMLCLLGIGSIHALTSVFRTDNWYYYFRNTVILYSMFAFFIGYCLREEIIDFLETTWPFLAAWILFFLVWPSPRSWFERFGVTVLFPAFSMLVKHKYRLLFLIGINCLYVLTHSSSTVGFLIVFYAWLWLCRSYKWFKISLGVAFIGLVVFFAAMVPHLDKIKDGFDHYSDRGILMVRASHPVLAIDPNSTWRLVLWKEVLVDHFPENLIGMGFGTPVMKYYPIEPGKPIPPLPYVMGAHNSFIYLFGRLGIGFIIIMALLYHYIFKAYYALRNDGRNDVLPVFWSFFAISIISFFNPTLETPIFASSYWLILGLLIKTIEQHYTPTLKKKIVPAA